ncbi:MAG: hypothetical protein AAFO15_01990 [Pseudomonadota bacterium]
MEGNYAVLLDNNNDNNENIEINDLYDDNGKEISMYDQNGDLLPKGTEISYQGKKWKIKHDHSKMKYSEEKIFLNGKEVVIKKPLDVYNIMIMKHNTQDQTHIIEITYDDLDRYTNIKTRNIAKSVCTIFNRGYEQII